jgi:dihydrofolate reductase
MRISIIAAVAENGVIGRQGKLPWRLSDDLRRFKQLTMGHTIIMGRRTWESIGRALPGRRTVVVSRNPEFRTDVDGVTATTSLEGALEIAEAASDNETFIIGGAELYRESFTRANRLELTRVRAEVNGDTYFPDIAWNDWQLVGSDEHDANEKNEYAYRFETYDRR